MQGYKQITDEVLVDVNNKQQATKLLAATRVIDLDITTTFHRSRNSWPGVIFEPDLLNKKMDADLLHGLMDQGVTAVGRIITILRDNKEIPTPHFILAFDRLKLPQFINAGFI